MDRYLPKVDIGIWDDGTIHIHHGYSNFDIRPRIHCNKNKEEGYDECSFHGYRLDGYGVNPVAETPEQMSVFNEKFTKWVIDQVKI